MTIPTQWYSICKLKKVEVMAQLTAKEIAFKISQHHMTLKSLLYKASKAVQDLLNQFKAIVGNDWTKAWRQSGKSLRDYKKSLLKSFHPDKNNGSKEASDISKVITGWSEPTIYDNLDQDVVWYSQCRDYARSVLSKERFLKFHKCAMENLRRRTCNRDAQWVEENRYKLYVVQYCNVSFGGDILTGGGDIYRGQDFTYVAPYTEEYEDGTIVNAPEVATQELIDELYQQRYDQWTRKSDHTIDPLSDKYYMMREVQELLAHMGLTYDFTNEAWYIKYQAEVEERRVEERRNDDIFLQYI